MSSKNEENQGNKEQSQNSNKGQSVELYTIERLALKNNVSEKVLAGVKAQKLWAKGKRVSKKEFNEAVDAFLGGQ